VRTESSAVGEHLTHRTMALMDVEKPEDAGLVTGSAGEYPPGT
jgi:hypothetical protein